MHTDIQQPRVASSIHSLVIMQIQFQYQFWYFWSLLWYWLTPFWYWLVLFCYWLGASFKRITIWRPCSAYLYLVSQCCILDPQCCDYAKLALVLDFGNSCHHFGIGQHPFGTGQCYFGTGQGEVGTKPGKYCTSISIIGHHLCQ